MSSGVDARRVADAIASIRDQIDRRAVGRKVHLIPVTKGFGADAVLAVAAAGCDMVGENYAQELIAKVQVVRATLAEPPQIHFIGQLQTNKVRQLASFVDVWQSVDRASLADEIARRAPHAVVFVQVNATGEPDKGGCQVDEVDGLVRHCRVNDLHVEGLMSIGPTSQDAAATIDAFALTRKLADVNGLMSCSMGMTSDMDAAIDNGATHVRLGRAVFGARPHPRTRIR